MTRVALIVENESVPRDRRVWLEARCLAEAGLDVTVISPRGQAYDLEAEVVLDGVRIVRFPLRASDGTMKGHVREYLEGAFRIARALWRERLDVDVVHVANPPDFLLLLAAPLKALHGTRLVFDHHDLFPELYESKFKRRGVGYRLALVLERSSFRLADLVISTNDSYRQVALERGEVNPDRAVVVRNAPDASTFVRGTPDPDLRRGRDYLAVYVGVIGPQDGADVAIRSLAVLKHELRRTDLHTAFVGDGDALDDCRRLARELDVEDIVEFVGWQETEAVVRYLSTADIALAPDPPSPLNDRSTMIKVIEYLAMGVPTISFDLRESMVTAGDMAVFVEGGDIEGFARAASDLLDDPKRRDELRVGGMERSRRHLSWEASKEALREGYRKLLSKPLPSDVSARSRAGRGAG
jgi:glycosyltransferase involved in cell wall biosynthesis